MQNQLWNEISQSSHGRTSMNYERLLSYGNVIQLRHIIDCRKLLNEIQDFKFAPYNSRKKNNPRYGLSITSLNGEINGIDLDSLIDAYETTGQVYNEMSFRTLTEVYEKSTELRKVVDPYKSFLGRTHFLKFNKGGYFPPHRDDRGSEEQPDFRIIVPIQFTNPPSSYYVFDGQIQHLNYGFAYFMNTNLEHSFFSFTDNALMIVMNIQGCSEAYKTVLDNMYST